MKLRKGSDLALTIGKTGTDKMLPIGEWREHESLITGGLAVLAGLVLLFNLWARSLENHDYLRYAEVAREMIRSGDWVTPRYNGDVYLDKPPLLFWLIAIPSALYGSVTPFLARLPSVLSAWVGAVVVFLFGRKLYGRIRDGILSAGILLSSYQYFSQARSAKTDILLCYLILAAFYSFYLGYEAERLQRYCYFGLSFFFMGLGVLTKGPFGFFIPFPVMALFLIKEKKASLLIGREFILGYLILLLVALPWALLFVDRFGLKESITLLKATHPLSRQAPFYFYFLEIWGQFAPWSLLLPFLGFYIWRERKTVWHSRESLFLIWFVLLFILLTLFKVRASRYLLPALPPLALMLGGRWRKNLGYFVMGFGVAILLWYGREMVQMRKDITYSPGKVLAEELKGAMMGEKKAGESLFYGYLLDISTLEELNFYLDPTTPIAHFEQFGGLRPHLGKGERQSILMPKKVYEGLQEEEGRSFTFVREFSYKKDDLVLTQAK